MSLLAFNVLLAPVDRRLPVLLPASPTNCLPPFRDPRHDDQAPTPRDRAPEQTAMSDDEKERRQQRYAVAWTDYLASEATPDGHLVTGHVAALLARDGSAAGARVFVDLGCGTGALYADLGAAGVAIGTYFGVDSNAALIQKARAEAGESARFAVADLADAAEQARVIDQAIGIAGAARCVFTLVRVLNYLPDGAASALLGALASRAPGAHAIILDIYPERAGRPRQDDPLQSLADHEVMGGADITHHLRDPFQYVDFLSARGVRALCARSTYLRGSEAPSHFVISCRFGTES